MLKLVFFTQDIRLRVRVASREDDFSQSFFWEDKIQFTLSDDKNYTMIWTSLLPDLEPIFAEALIRLVSARYPVSPDYPRLKEMCPRLIFQSQDQEWVFFGGTFNPWHEGHQSCLNLLPEDKLCFILPDQNPQKNFRNSHMVSEFLQISTHARFKKKQFLVPSFLLLKEKNPTVEWIEKLAEEFPTIKLSLLMGFDSFAHLKSWIRIDDLLKHLHGLYVVSRQETEEQKRKALDYVNGRAPVKVAFLGSHPFESLSSSSLRAKKEGD